jgi:hypothetical protein
VGTAGVESRRRRCPPPYAGEGREGRTRVPDCLRGKQRLSKVALFRRSNCASASTPSLPSPGYGGGRALRRCHTLAVPTQPSPEGEESELARGRWRSCRFHFAKIAQPVAGPVAGGVSCVCRSARRPPSPPRALRTVCGARIADSAGAGAGGCHLLIPPRCAIDIRSAQRARSRPAGPCRIFRISAEALRRRPVAFVAVRPFSNGRPLTSFWVAVSACNARTCL